MIRDFGVFEMAQSTTASDSPPGWCLRPLASGGCQVSYLVEMDLCGSLPGSLVASVVAQQALTPSSLLKAMDKLDPALLAAVAAVDPGADGARLAAYILKTRCVV